MMKFVKAKKAKESGNQNETSHDISQPFDFKKVSYAISVGGAVHLVCVVGDVHEAENSANREVVRQVLENASRPDRPDDLNTSKFNRSLSHEDHMSRSSVLSSRPGSTIINYINAASPLSPSMTDTSSSSTPKGIRDTWSCLDNIIPPTVPAPPLPPRTYNSPNKSKVSPFYEDENKDQVQLPRRVENHGYITSSNEQQWVFPSPQIPSIMEANFYEETLRKTDDSLPLKLKAVHIGEVWPDVLPPARPPPPPCVDSETQCDLDTLSLSPPAPIVQLEFTEARSEEYYRNEIDDMSTDEIRKVAEDMDNFFMSQMMEKVDKMMKDTEKRIEKNAAKIAKKETMNTLQREIVKTRPSLSLCENNGETISHLFEPIPHSELPHQLPHTLPEDPSPVDSVVDLSRRSSYLVHQSSEEEASTRF